MAHTLSVLSAGHILQVQIRLCTAVTLAAAVPAMVHQMLCPSTPGLLLCMANSAFAFFLFSFQVLRQALRMTTPEVCCYRDIDSTPSAKLQKPLTWQACSNCMSDRARPFHNMW